MKKERQLKILHIGWGFYPWRKGGLILYTRDLIKTQREFGHDVSYFCAGRRFPIITKTFLKNWKLKGLNVYEIINSPIIHGGDCGTLSPNLTLSDHFSEKFFRQVLMKIRPEIIHIHELAGLPSSLIDIIVDEFHIPCIMTLADYYMLCPSLKLYNHSKKTQCQDMSHNIGTVCFDCIMSAEGIRRNDVFETASYFLNEIETFLNIANLQPWKSFRSLSFKIYYFFQLRREEVILKNLNNKKREEKDDHLLKREFYQRRKVNLERLKKITCLIARSTKVREIYESYLCGGNNISVVNPYLRHIDSIFKKNISAKIGNTITKVKFVTLNGFVSAQKGGDLLRRAFISLNMQGFSDKFELHSFGGFNSIYFESLETSPNFFNHGSYEATQLDKLLDPMHIGIVPSIWEEVFGYVGIELLAKGLPVIANKKGGITDYLKNHENGLINESCSADGLVILMKEYIENKDLILKHNGNIHKSMDKSYFMHYSTIMEKYNMAIEL